MVARNKTNSRKTIKREALERTADASVMLSATQRANERDSGNRTRGYFYGNMGDSIERRASPIGGGGLYGGGMDGPEGMGPGGTWQAAGYGSYMGTGLLNGYGRMFSGGFGGNGYGQGFTYLKRFSSQSAFNHSVIAQCMLAYLGYGVVRNIIDLYADFATEGLDIDHADASVRNFYRTWATKVNLIERVHSMFLNLFVSGNVFVHRRWASLDEEEKRAMKRAKASEMVDDMLIIRGKSRDRTIQANEAGFIDWYLTKGEVHLKNDAKNGKTVGKAPPAPSEEDMPENADKRIPWGYTFLNPLQMEIRGRRVRGDHYWIMAVDKRDTLDIARGYGMSTRQELGTTEINLPKEFLSRVKKYQGPGVGYSAEVRLNKEELTVIQAPGKWDWFDWAVPFCFPALQSLHFKDSLRTMELRAMQSVINSVTLFKLGDIEKGMPAEDEHFERLADMLQMPGQSLNIIWNEAISAEVIQPDVDGLFGIDKHQSADQDILTALGVPEVLLGGKGGNFSNSYIAVATVLEKLESARMKVSNWLMGEMKLIADAMGFQKLPTVKFGRTSLRDEKAYQTFILGLYDRGILSANTLLEEIDTTAEVQASQMKEEKENLREKDIFEPKGPFVKDPKPPPGAAVKPGGGKVPPKKNGRPGGSSTGPTGKQGNPRPPKGRNLAELLELQDNLLTRGRAMFDQLETFTSERILRAKARENPNLKHLKQLRAQEKEELEQLIYNVFSHMPAPANDDPLKDDFIINMLQSNAVDRVKADVLEIYANKISEYSSRFQKQPTREMRRQFMVSAWTQCAIMRHMEEMPDLLST